MFGGDIERRRTRSTLKWRQCLLSLVVEEFSSRLFLLFVLEGKLSPFSLLDSVWKDWERWRLGENVVLTEFEDEFGFRSVADCGVIFTAYSSVTKSNWWSLSTILSLSPIRDFLMESNRRRRCRFSLEERRSGEDDRFRLVCCGNLLRLSISHRLLFWCSVRPGTASMVE